MTRIEGWSNRIWFLFVSVIAVLTRLGLWSIYPLSINNDSPTYQQLARSILNKGFSTYNATRSPGYPAFLALSGDSAYPIQLLLGVLTTWLFFYIGWKLSGRGWFGALAALLYSLNLGQLFFEATLLTEALTTCLIAACFAATLATCAHPLPANTGRPKRPENLLRWPFFAILAGLAATMAGMVRPLFAVLPVLLSSYYLLFFTTPLRRRIAFGFLAALPAIFIFGWWLNFVNSNYKILSFDTIGGFRWLNHTGEYFEYVPDKYAAIRDTYIKYRDAKIATTGTQTNAVWDAMDELQKNSKLGFYALSRKLTDISMELIRAHPDLYLKNVLSGWWMYWWAPVYWSPETLAIPALIPLIRGMILIERAVMLLGNLLFIGVTGMLLTWKKARAALEMSPFLWLVLGSIWMSSLAQTVLDHGDNPRYLAPLQSILLVLVAWWLYQIIPSLKTDKK